VPEAPLAKALGKLREASQPNDANGRPTAPDADAVSKAVDDVAQALAPSKEKGKSKPADSDGCCNHGDEKPGKSHLKHKPEERENKAPAQQAQTANSHARPQQLSDDQYSRLEELLKEMGIPPAEAERVIEQLKEKLAAPQGAEVGGDSGAVSGSQATRRSATPTPVNPTHDTSGTSAAHSLSPQALKNNPEIAKWNKEITAASKATGLPPEQIAAQMWAESRGRLDTHTRNMDGTTDHGLVQIGQERWGRDIVPKLSQAERNSIIEATGKQPEDLDVTKSLDNVVAGAFHAKKIIEEKGGDVDAGLNYYVAGSGGGGELYVSNVNAFMDELRAGKKLSERAGI